jgi:ParB family transcriptional regulator, chromosome partitioning protein
MIMTDKTEAPTLPIGNEEELTISMDRESILQIPIENVDVDAAARLVKQDAVDAIAKSFRCVGQIHPIHLYKEPDGRLRLVTGRHRLEAAKKLGWKRIEAKMVDLDEIEREIMKIDENLIRAELTELEFAEHLERRKKLFDEKGGAKIRTPGGEQELGFDKMMAENIGRDKSTIRKARTRAEKIAPEIRDAIRGTPAAEKGTELDALAAMTVEEQERAVSLCENQEVKSFREARSKIEIKPDPSQEERDENDFKRIRVAWDKSGEAGRRKFDEWLARNVASASAPGQEAVQP